MPDPELEGLLQQLIDAGGTDEELDELADSYVSQKQEAASTAERNKFVGDVYKGPDTFWGGVLNSINPFGGGEALKASAQGAKGYARGAVTDIPQSIAGAVASIPRGYAGMYDMIAGSTPESIYETAKGIPYGLAEGGRAIGNAVLSAGSDPEGFGRTVGQITGQPAVTAGLAPHAPAAIRAAGTPVEFTGRMMREHAPLSGAIPRMVEPRIARTAERALGGQVERFGRGMQSYGAPSQTPPPLLPPPRSVTPTPTPMSGGPVPNVPPNTYPVNAPPPVQRPPKATGTGSTTSVPPKPSANTTTPPNPNKGSSSTGGFTQQVMRDPDAPRTGDPEIDAILESFKQADQPVSVVDADQFDQMRTRYYELVDKGTAGTITAQELQEAQQLDKVLRDMNFERPTVPNASGESAASAESMSRNTGMRERGEKYVAYDKAGNKRDLIGPDAVDYVPGRGETYGIETPHGFILLEDNGGKVTATRTIRPKRREYPGFKGEQASGQRSLEQVYKEQLARAKSMPPGLKRDSMIQEAQSKLKSIGMKNWAAKQGEKK